MSDRYAACPNCGESDGALYLVQRTSSEEFFRIKAFAASPSEITVYGDVVADEPTAVHGARISCTRCGYTKVFRGNIDWGG